MATIRDNTEKVYAVRLSPSWIELRVSANGLQGRITRVKRKYVAVENKVEYDDMGHFRAKKLNVPRTHTIECAKFEGGQALGCVTIDTFSRKLGVALPKLNGAARLPPEAAKLVLGWRRGDFGR